MAKARSDQYGVHVQSQSEDAAADLYRLRVARSVLFALRRAYLVEAARQGGRQARL